MGSWNPNQRTPSLFVSPFRGGTLWIRRRCVAPAAPSYGTTRVVYKPRLELTEQVNWDSSKDERLWGILSGVSNTDIDCKYVLCAPVLSAN